MSGMSPWFVPSQQCIQYNGGVLGFPLLQDPQGLALSGSLVWWIDSAFFQRWAHYVGLALENQIKITWDLNP
jgi:hypothetical protein